MTRRGTTRHGSLQFYPRVRSKEFLPSVNWSSVISKKDVGILGFVGYKAGMMSAYVKDNTANSLTKGKKIIIPVTILECPMIKILSVRFYKDKKIIGEVMNKNLDKELKRKIKLPKEVHRKIEDFEPLLKKDGDKKSYYDIRLVVYTEVRKTGVKKAPDIVEIGIFGELDQKLEFAKAHFNKDITVKDFMKEGIVDIRGVTKGKGLQGTVKRFGLTLKGHKSEKGQRTLGSGGPWHPSRVDFTQPRAGQMGFFTRIVYNNKVLYIGNIAEKDINPAGGFRGFGKIRSDYMIIRGSVQGPAKRQLLITMPLRPSKKQNKKNYEFLELR